MKSANYIGCQPMAGDPFESVRISLSLETLALTPEELTAHLGILPDRTHRRGDRRRYVNQTWNHNGWSIAVAVTSRQYPGFTTWELLPLAEDLFAVKIQPAVRKFSSIESGDVQRSLIVALTVDYVPGIRFSPHFLDLAGKLGCTLQVDLALCSSESDVVD